MSEEKTRPLPDEESVRTYASAELLPLVYEELRRLAAAKLAREQPGQTLQPTALVHEAWLRLEGDRQQWDNRRHFFAAAAESMRRILVERARRKAAIRRGGGLQRVDIDEIDVATEDNADTILFVDDVVERLSVVNPVGAQLINLRFFVGLINREAAELLGLSEDQARDEWDYVRAWLAREVTRRRKAGEG